MYYNLQVNNAEYPTDGWMNVCLTIAQNKTAFSELVNDEFYQNILLIAFRRIPTNFDLYSNLIGVVGDRLSDSSFQIIARQLADAIIAVSLHFS